MRIGIRDGCLKQGWAEAFKTTAELGFDGVELDIGGDYKQTPLWADGDVAQVAAMAQDSGAELLSFCAGVCWTLSPASPDAAIRSEIFDLLTDLSAFAAKLEARVILVPVTPGGDDVTHEDGTAGWIEGMKAVAPAAEANGVVLALENVGRGYGKSAEELIHLTDSVGSSAVGVYYDIGNATAFENDPVAEIEALGSRIAAVHIKDYQGALLGEGIVKIAESLEALKAIGYSGDLILETDPTDDPRSAAAANLAYLQGLL